MSEDVDFSVSRPEGFGCYKWSIPNEYGHLIRLDTHYTNQELMCGNKLAFQILPGSSDTSVDFVISGENTNTIDYDNGM